jgi:hypothetical protein
MDAKMGSHLLGAFWPFAPKHPVRGLGASQRIIMHESGNFPSYPDV